MLGGGLGAPCTGNPRYAGLIARVRPVDDRAVESSSSRGFANGFLERVVCDVHGMILGISHLGSPEDAWSFPKLEGHVLGVFVDLGEMSLIDEASDLFTYRLSSLASGWYEHLMRERNCLLVTGVDLRLATDGMAGIKPDRTSNFPGLPLGTWIA